MIRNATLLLMLAVLAGCGGPHQTTPSALAAAPSASAAKDAAPPLPPQVPPVEFGHRAPNSKLSSANMPFFDVKTYCEFATRKLDKAARGPAYDSCAEDQLNYRGVIGAAIDAGKYTEAKVDACAKASRTAYHGMWFCMNDQPYS